MAKKWVKKAKAGAKEVIAKSTVPAEGSKEKELLAKVYNHPRSDKARSER